MAEDPNQTSGAANTHGYKQLPFEPFLGGGLVTALALPLIDAIGAGWALLGATLVTVLCILAGIRLNPARSGSTSQIARS